MELMTFGMRLLPLTILILRVIRHIRQILRIAILNPFEMVWGYRKANLI